MSAVRVRYRGRRAFSLIELLVVISIVVLLAALLLPTMRIVRDTAQAAKCASNMRQIGMYIEGYATDKDGLYPGGGNVASGSSASWCDILDIELFSADGITLQRSGNGGTNGFRCPRFVADTASTRCFTMNANAVGGAVQEYTTVYTANLSQFGQSYATWTRFFYGTAVTRFVDRPDKVLLQETQSGSDACKEGGVIGSLALTDMGAYRTGANIAFRHGGNWTANFLFMDLHIEAQRADPSMNTAARFRFSP